ncbi:hypothetical protein Q3V23_00060 [Streptomyces sp. VNUA116]|uniref:hypothetical protein n=1 Tax=Streptomyces sp. VNUA116 TaxID=3062449 RepID=UPI002674F928|nr:hypothetical protein [Streptomyces sp. VNUA116]WKU42595.1 hypothetical protein Q3V23_00060 [Streptomyces sp. VNUA116]
MSHGNSLTQQARYRARCTGRGHQSEHQFLSATRPTTAIPEASGDQALLEAALFEHANGTASYCVHPAGVHSVDPRTDHLTMRLDPLLGRPDRPLAEHCLATLLPTQNTRSDEDPYGVPGIRLLSIDDRGLHLGMADSNASATLTGPTTAQWHAHLAAHRALCTESGLAPLWETASLSTPEAAFRAKHPTWQEILHRSAWLGSGLLRRIGLFHTVSNTYGLSYWFDGQDWKFELRYEHGVPVNHDELVQYLTHPAWGLPMRVDHRYCECRPCDCDGGRERICWIELVPTSSRATGISFRFRSTAKDRDLTDEYRSLIDSGASASWLERVLPKHHRQVNEAVAV